MTINQEVTFWRCATIVLGFALLMSGSVTMMRLGNAEIRELNHCHYMLSTQHTGSDTLLLVHKYPECFEASAAAGR